MQLRPTALFSHDLLSPGHSLCEHGFNDMDFQSPVQLPPLPKEPPSVLNSPSDLHPASPRVPHKPGCSSNLWPFTSSQSPMARPSSSGDPPPPLTPCLCPPLAHVSLGTHTLSRPCCPAIKPHHLMLTSAAHILKPHHLLTSTTSVRHCTPTSQGLRQVFGEAAPRAP